MEKPKILLTGTNPDYIQAVEGAGGIAVAKYLCDVDLSCDGLILNGGSDIDPAYYGEDVDGAENMLPERDQWEFEVVKMYIEAGKPVFGICRGFQLVNIYFGGSLHQHIENHSNAIHSVSAVDGSILQKLYGESFPVNSLHHQAVKLLGEGLKVVATSKEDGFAEAIVHESLPVMGVQWHPERMCYVKRNEKTVDAAPLIEYFIQMCRK